MTSLINFSTVVDQHPADFQMAPEAGDHERSVSEAVRGLHVRTGSKQQFH